MRLAVPTRVSLALRRATSSPVSLAAAAAAATRARSHRSKAAAAAAVPSAAEVLQRQQLAQLSELCKVSNDVLSSTTKGAIEMLSGPGRIPNIDRLKGHVIGAISGMNDFAALAKLLESLPNEEKAPNLRFVSEVIRTAVMAKSLGALPPSILDWIEKAVRRLPEPVPRMKESMLWLLSILRSDLPQLQLLQQDSIDKNGVVGPAVERATTLRHAALAYLEAGKADAFRSLWTAARTPLLEEAESRQCEAAMLHHAMLRSAARRKPDPSMLRWYAESLAAHQRTPIPEQPQFKTMMEPVIRALGGKIERWRWNDRRIGKLRKWRGDYDDAQLDALVQSMLDFMRHQIVQNEVGSCEDQERVESMLARLEGESREGTVVVDWLNFIGEKSHMALEDLFPSRPLVVVGRERWSEGDPTPRSPEENERVKVMEVTKKREKKQEMDDFCSLILTVVTRGHLLTNDKTRLHIGFFAQFLKDESRDVSQTTLLKNYLDDAVLRHDGKVVQPAVDHSRAAQWIDKEKKELAFTVASKTKRIHADSPFRTIDYYSLRIN